MSLQNTIGWFLVPLVLFSWFQVSIVLFGGSKSSSDYALKFCSKSWLCVPPVVSLACTTLFYVLYSAHPLKVRIGGTVYLVYFALLAFFICLRTRANVQTEFTKFSKTK